MLLPWHRACALAATTLVFGAAAAAPAEMPVITLEQAVTLALQHNPTLRAGELGVASASAGEVTAGLRPNPTLGNETADFTLMVTQLIELGGKRARRMDSARLATEVAHRDFAEVRRTLLLSVRATFAAGLLAQSNLALAQENLENFRRVEELSRLRLEAGDIARAELLKVQLQELQFAGDVQDATLALATAKAALRALLSAPDLPEDFGLEATPPIPDDDRSLEALKAQALVERPDLRAAETTVQKAQADFRLARANRTPDLSLVAGWQHIGPSFGPSWFQPFYGKGPRSNTFGLGLSVPLRIFDHNQGEIARTRVEIDRATALARSARDQVLSNVETAYAALRISRQRVALYEATFLAAAKESREIAEFAYQKGGASIIDLLDAERTYRATLIAYEQAKSAHLSSVFQLEAAVGSDSAR